MLVCLYILTNFMGFTPKSPQVEMPSVPYVEIPDGIRVIRPVSNLKDAKPREERIAMNWLYFELFATQVCFALIMFIFVPAFCR